MTEPSKQSTAPAGKGFLVPMSVLLVVAALMNYSTTVMPVLAPEAAADLGIDLALIGFYSSFMSAGSILVLFVSWPLIARFGGLRGSQLCLLLVGGGLLLTLFGGPAALFASAFISGIGLGAGTPCSSQVLALHTPPRHRGLVFSIKQAGVPLGGVALGLVVPWIVLNYGWRVAVLSTALACIAVILIVQPFRAKYESERTQSFRIDHPAKLITTPLRLVLGNRRLRRVTFAATCFVMMQYALTTFLVAYLHTRIGLSLTEAGIVFTAAAGSAIASRILFGLMADSAFGPHRTLAVLGFVMSGAAVAVALLSPDWPFWAILAACTLLGTAAMGWNGVVLAALANMVPPGQAGPATAASQLFNYTGIMTGPAAFSGILLVTDSYGIAYGVMAAAAAGAGLLMLLSAEKPAIP
ncbi:MAG: MFS transporter [Alphaproteobacteria bacterium]